MTQDESKEMTKWLLGLFPTLTKEQCVEWRDRLVRFDKEIVRDAVRRYQEFYQYLETPKLLEFVREEQRKRIARIDAQNTADARLKAEQQRICDEVNALSDEELAGLKAEVLALMPENVREVRKNLNPRTAIGLQQDIYALVMKSETLTRDPTEPRRVSAPALNGIDL